MTAQQHEAEAFQQWYPLRWGWQCRTCGDKQYVPTMQAALDAAAAHTSGSQDAPSPTAAKGDS